MTIWKTEAERVLGINLKPHAAGELAGSCPDCGGKDRFIVFEDGGSWCRQCHHRIQWKAPDGKHIYSKNRRRQQALSKMILCTDWVYYHRETFNGGGLAEYSRSLWLENGISAESVAKWGLGYTRKCPLFPLSDSLTIPIFFGGLLMDIRHKLLQPTEDSGKYRSHVAGSGWSVFNGDVVSSGWWSVVVEGEKKAIILDAAGIVSCSIAGIQNYRSLLVLAKRNPGSKLLLAMDPGVEKQTISLCGKLKRLGAEVRIASFPIKPDDLLLEHGVQVVLDVISQARRM